MELSVRNVIEGWKQIARKIGDVQARLILILFYFLIVGPFALLIRWRGDPLALKPHATRGWLTRRTKQGTLMNRAVEQF